MKKHLFIFSALLIFTIEFAKAQTTFQKAYGTTYDEAGGAFTKTAYEGYIQVGSTNAGSSGNYDVYMVKTDSNGVIQWTKLMTAPIQMLAAILTKK